MDGAVVQLNSDILPAGAPVYSTLNTSTIVGY
jgi:hypothetical protein